MCPQRQAEVGAVPIRRRVPGGPGAVQNSRSTEFAVMERRASYQDEVRVPDR